MAPILYISNLLRSIVIDYLRLHPRLGILLFFYFSNEESAENQSLSKLMSSFIKQLVILTGRMPSSLQIAHSSKNRPDGQRLINIFKEYCQNLLADVYVFLDAFDECQSAHHPNIVSLIQNLNESGIRVYITMRDFLLGSGLFTTFNVEPLRISADEDDVKKFVEFRLKERMPLITKDLQTSIIQSVTGGIDGMYPL
jgi:hypothetical protein